MKSLRKNVWPGRMVVSLTLILLASMAAAQQGSGQEKALAKALAGRFDLAGQRSPQVQYFLSDCRVVHLGFDGKRTGTEGYILKLRCNPAALTGKEGDEYTCRSFVFQRSDGRTVKVPALAGWTYTFKTTPTGKDEQGQVLGIPHAKFEGLADSEGAKLPPGISYMVYNSFIDFHSFNDLLSRPVPEGKGIQDLDRVGQRIVHSASFSQPATNLGTNIKEGSFFRNGEITMELKGVGLVDEAPCAIVGYDSGESTFKMIVAFGGGKDILTEGGSEYAGDISIDLETRWLRKLSLNKFIVSETALPVGGGKMDSYTVRHLLIRLISREEYERD